MASIQGNPATLAYRLPVPVQPGDVVILGLPGEDASNGGVSDVLRFTDTVDVATGTLQGWLLFYSDSGPGDSDGADTGIPSDISPLAPQVVEFAESVIPGAPKLFSYSADNGSIYTGFSGGSSVGVTSVGDAGFEAPSVGAGSFDSFQYAPAGTPWSFAGGAGISGNGSGFTSGNPPAPEGAQVAFLQQTGSFSQTVAGIAAGSYQVSFQAAQRVNWQASRQDFAVKVDGLVVGTFTPAGTAYAAYSTATFRLDAGAHTISFQGLDTAGGDNTAFLDAVRVVTA